MLKSVKVSFIRVSVLLALCHCGGSLIIPEELPTILSLIYSNIPPIKKGTDSRIGVGFRLGEHADFQVLLELGPQSETDPIGTGDTKRRRDAMLNAAMRGELGPVAQAVARYQTERRIQRELEKLKEMRAKLKTIGSEKGQNETIDPNDWLAKWRQGMEQPTVNHVPLNQVPSEKIVLKVAGSKQIQQKMEQPSPDPKRNSGENKIEQLKQLYKVQTADKSA